MATIDVHSFGFTYAGTQRPAVRDVSFTVEPREVFGFLGPSGAGKSTTQNVLIRLLDGYEGHIRILERDLRDWDRSYYRRTGVSFEAPNHYLKLTALENLRLFAGLMAATPNLRRRCCALSACTKTGQARRRVLEGDARQADIGAGPAPPGASVQRSRRRSPQTSASPRAPDAERLEGARLKKRSGRDTPSGGASTYLPCAPRPTHFQTGWLDGIQQE